MGYYMDINVNLFGLRCSVNQWFGYCNSYCVSRGYNGPIQSIIQSDS